MSQPTATRYELLEVLGRGSFGEVLRARDRYLGREVAIKVIHAKYQQHTKVVERLAVEAQALARLQHAHIIPIFDSGRLSDGRPFFSMPLIHGMTLEQRAAEFHRQAVHTQQPVDYHSPTFVQLVRHLADAARAMAYAHHRGLLHRDLKPGNILTTAAGETFVVDWGTARIETSQATEWGEVAAASRGTRVTMVGELLGTPAYMSPELARGEAREANSASDIYGLGAALYHLLLGRGPHQGEDLQQVLKQAQRGQIRGPAAQLEQVPGELLRCCARALAAEPQARHASATAFEAELREFLDDVAPAVQSAAEPLRSRINSPRSWHQLAVIPLVLTLCFVTTLALLLGRHVREQERLLSKWRTIVSSEVQEEGNPRDTTDIDSWSRDELVGELTRLQQIMRQLGE